MKRLHHTQVNTPSGTNFRADFLGTHNENSSALLLGVCTTRSPENRVPKSSKGGCIVYPGLAAIWYVGQESREPFTEFSKIKCTDTEVRIIVYLKGAADERDRDRVWGIKQNLIPNREGNTDQAQWAG